MPHERESGKFCLWNLESWALESGIQLKECGISQTVGNQFPSSTERMKNPVPRIRNPQRGIKNQRLSSIPNIVNVPSFRQF